MHACFWCFNRIDESKNQEERFGFWGIGERGGSIELNCASRSRYNPPAGGSLELTELLSFKTEKRAEIPPTCHFECFSKL